MDLNGTGGDVLLLFYIIGGLATIGSGLLPGSKIGWRVFSIVAGLVMTIWAGWVLLFGGWILISFKVLIMPVLLVIRGVRAAFKRRDESTQPQFQGAPQVPGAPAFAPQPGQPQPAYPQPGHPQAPYAAAPVQGGYPAPSAPQGQPGYPAPPVQPVYPAPQVQQGYAAPPVQPGYPVPQVQPGYPAPSVQPPTA
ncbi:hypothetical protein [Dactylosporangium sp. NPDC048998]|uniref:hypothetical protein n=1 Tax=Dactylosporangium sp. NPDC048998 TaxID=3363976 RepID=UPI00371E7BBC